ncbi:MAG TPA: hypothetical protein VD932_06280 [Aquabacterium sp.]|nr:hypothetical protein [Aquabacterium sp.]
MKGSLLDAAEAASLSRKLYRLADQVSDICGELDRAGYGDPARAMRHELEALAGTEEGARQLWTYWSEYAKERLAGLVGPMNVLEGKLPSVAAYRSEMLDNLRARAVAGELRPHGPISSPQIEPTMKRYVEMLPDDPLAIRINDAVKRARKLAAQKLALPELQEFAGLPAKARYDLLIGRYSASLLPDGFALDSHRRTGVVFRRLTSDARWSLVFVDDSRDGVDVGMLSTRFGITLPKKAVLPNSLPATVAAAFDADDIVPGFSSVRSFTTRSHAEFCLAADACAYLARILYGRVDAILC